MKQFILVLVAMVAFGVTYAQNLSLRNETRVTLSLNWSEASIMGYNEKEVINFEQDWNKDQPVLLRKMVDAYNKKMGYRLPGITDFESNYTLESSSVPRMTSPAMRSSRTVKATSSPSWTNSMLRVRTSVLSFTASATVSRMLVRRWPRRSESSI